MESVSAEKQNSTEQQKQIARSILKVPGIGEDRRFKDEKKNRRALENCLRDKFRNSGVKKKPRSFERGFYNLRQRHTLPRVTSVPSALLGLTALFGMGRGGHQR